MDDSSGHPGAWTTTTSGKLALALGAIALIVGPARAQPPGTYGPGRGMGGFIMLRIKSVQRELRATPEQARKLDGLFDDMLAKFKANEQLNGVPQEFRRAKYLELQRPQREDLRRRLAEVLKPEQIRRFEQIDVQQAGIDAFESPRVREALKLTDDQKARFRQIDWEMRTFLLGTIGDVKKDPKAAMNRVIEAQARALAECLAGLTDDQKATWKDLTGEPFVIVVEP